MATPEFENTISFVGRITTPPDHRQYFPPKPKKQSPDRWVRDLEITGLYLGTGQTQEEIGAKYHLTRAAIHLILKKSLSQLYQSSEERLKDEFPRESLGTAKPLPIGSRRRTLSSWRADLPYEQKAKSPIYRQNLALLLTNTLPYQEAQAIIDQVTHSTLYTHSLGDKPDFLSVAKLARRSGLTVSFRHIQHLIQVLKDNHVPTGLIEEKPRLLKRADTITYSQRYYFIPSCYEERAKAVLQNHPELASFSEKPVLILGNKSTETPTRQQLLYSGSYKSVGRLLDELGHHFFMLHSRLTTEDLIGPNCPVSIFVIMKQLNFYYRVDDEEVLRTFLLDRIAQLKP